MREKKGTKVSWIGEIPLEWELKKIKRVFKTTNGYGFPDKLQGQQTGDIPFLKVSDFPKNSDFILSSSNYVSLDTLNKKNWKTTEPMSIITAKIGEAMKKNHRKISVEPCLIDNNMMALSVKKGHLKYFFYASKIIDFSWFANPGAVPSLNHRQFRESYIMSPPIVEQQNIASFLNQKTSEIDTLIEDKEKLIALLEEKRQAIITEAVTKGLDPDVKMKDSGVEWIGDIPEHWSKTKLKYLGKAIIGLTYSPNDIVSSSEGTLVLRSNNIQNGKIFTNHIDKNVYVSRKIPEKLRIKKGDILICSRNGSRHLIGKSGYAGLKHEGYSFGAFTTVYRSNYNKFIYYLFMSNLFQSQIGTYLTSTINQLTISSLNNIEIAFPPPSEQDFIVNYLNNFTKDSDFLIDKEKELIQKLKEYRQALIYEAVTGKIDVQEMLKETEQEEVSSS